MLHELDLENWEYYIKKPNEELTEGKTIFVENLNLGDLEFELLQSIKNDSPTSISDLAKKINKEVSIVQKKVKILEQADLIGFKNGTKNRKIPIVNYDKIEIAI
jgi:predicted transcriptional regulator